MPSPLSNMITTIHHLKQYRRRAKFAQHDVATLLNIAPTNLIRYENGLRNPTPEIIITYHILFGASLQELFEPLVKKVKQNLVKRSALLMDHLKNDPSPKSVYRIEYLRSIVNLLSPEENDTSRVGE